jgi:hypothetical protein
MGEIYNLATLFYTILRGKNVKELAPDLKSDWTKVISTEQL